MGYVPIGELPDALDDDHQGLAWRIEPSAAHDPDTIEVNARHLMRTARIAGFGGIIVRQYMGEQAGHGAASMNITGMNFDGSATGTATTTATKAERERLNITDTSDAWIGSEYKWPVATIEVNRNEMASRAADRAQKGQPREKAWVEELDASLRRGMSRLAWKKLRTDFHSDTLDRLGTGWYTGWLIADSLPPDALDYATTIGFIYAPLLALRSITNRHQVGDTLIKQRRWSAFPLGVQPDRVAVSSLVAHSSRYVRYCPSK